MNQTSSRLLNRKLGMRDDIALNHLNGKTVYVSCESEGMPVIIQYNGKLFTYYRKLEGRIHYIETTPFLAYSNEK